MSHPLRRPQLARGVAGRSQAATANVKSFTPDLAITPPLAIEVPDQAPPRP